MIYDRIKELCRSYGIAITKLEQTLGFAKGSLSKIDRFKPSSERVQKLADFFGVTPTYILTGEQEGYYLNAETAQIAQEMFEDPDMRTLYALKEKIGTERFRAHIELMRKLYEKEHPND